jgi:hypothetical protein
MDETLEVIVILIVPFLAIPILIILTRCALRISRRSEYEIELQEVSTGKSPVDRKIKLQTKFKYNEYLFNIRRFKIFTPIGKFFSTTNA